MNYSKTIYGLSDQAFWEVAFDKLNADKQKEFIITKVLNHGNWEDVLSVMVYYGKDTVRQSLINADYLQEHAIDLARWLVDVKPTELKCYLKKQYHPTC